MNKKVCLAVMLALVIVFGGIVSLLFSLALFESPLALFGFLGAPVAGVIEEPGKLLALIVV